MPHPIIACKLYKYVVNINSKYIFTVQIYFCVMHFSFLTKSSKTQENIIQFYMIKKLFDILEIQHILTSNW